MNICVIPARGGSTRIPRKNIRVFAEKPILQRAIETAQQAGIFDEIIVSSEDHAILEHAIRCNAHVHLRSVKMSCNEVGTQEVIRDVLQGVQGPTNPHDIVCGLYPCTPLLLPTDLVDAYLELNADFDYVMSVGYPPLQDAGAFYFGWDAAFRGGQPLIGNRTRFHLLPPERVCDINTEEDWQRALNLYARMQP
jgi:CMP-N-acetylneuraminic acid synthetase